MMGYFRLLCVLLSPISTTLAPPYNLSMIYLCYQYTHTIRCFPSPGAVRITSTSTTIQPEHILRMLSYFGDRMTNDKYPLLVCIATSNIDNVDFDRKGEHEYQDCWLYPEMTHRMSEFHITILSWASGRGVIIISVTWASSISLVCSIDVKRHPINTCVNQSTNRQSARGLATPPVGTHSEAETNHRF